MRAYLYPPEYFRGFFERWTRRFGERDFAFAPWSYTESGLNIVAAGEIDCYVLPFAISVRASHEWIHRHTQDDLLELFADLARTMPAFGAHARQHVVLVWGDYAGSAMDLEAATVLKVSAHRSGTAHCIPYYISDLDDRLTLRRPIDQSIVDVWFRGDVTSHPVRSVMASLGPAFERYGFNFSFTKSDDGQVRDKYLAELESTKFVLCPRGHGLSSARFFETLALGRIPVLFADDTKLPAEDKIDYQRFVVRVPQDRVMDTADYVATFANTHDLVMASAAARASYQLWLRYCRFGQLVRSYLST